jgi:tetratricopeptide (TPR) repeat protein
MNLPSWNNLVLDDGILREAVAEANRLVLWVRGAGAGKFRDWERISTAARAEVEVKQGLGAVPATLIAAREPLRGLFGKLMGRLQKSSDNPSWLLPDGTAAEQQGERQTDWLLVWSEDAATTLTETLVQARCPEGKEFRRLGPALFLVRGVAAPAPKTTAGSGEPRPAPPNPGRDAEEFLTAARAKGDRRAEAVALTDLGVVTLQAGNAPQAATLLEQALTLSRTLGDRKQEADVLGNLGIALAAIGQVPRAREVLEQCLVYARSVSDVFGEKSALTGLGLASIRTGQQAQALAYFEQAAALAEQAGDRQNLADLLWYQSVQQAELGRREQALAKGQATVDLLRQLNNPKAAVFAEHLEKFRQGDTAMGPGVPVAAGPAGVPDSPFGWSMTSDALVSASRTGPRSGPGWLRMALSAAKAVGKFVGSGLKTVPADLHKRRLQTCATCEHHTGMRCRLCGCYTKAKAWMPHEHCPIEKWPAQ